MSKSIAEKTAREFRLAIPTVELTVYDKLEFEAWMAIKIQRAIDEAVGDAVIEALAQQKRYNRKKLHDMLFKMKKPPSGEEAK